MAYAGLADAYELLSIGFSSKPPAEYLAQAKSMALKALEMDDTLAEAHTSLAYARWLGDLDWPGAEREFKRALELKSSYVMAHEWYAEYLAALGRHDEALAETKRAQQLDPLAVPVNRAVGWVLYFARRYDEAIEELRKTLAMNAEFLGARLVLWWVYIAKGAHDQAIADIRREVEKPGLRTVKKLMLAYACAAAGNKEEANGLLWELEPKLAEEHRLALLSALLFTALGEQDRAFEQLERAFEMREPGLLFLKVAPWAESPAQRPAVRRARGEARPRLIRPPSPHPRKSIEDAPGPSRPIRRIEHALPVDASSPAGSVRRLRRAAGRQERRDGSGTAGAAAGGCPAAHRARSARRTGWAASGVRTRSSWGSGSRTWRRARTTSSRSAAPRATWPPFPA